MTAKKGTPKKTHRMYYSDRDRALTQADIERGYGMRTPLGIRYQHERHVDDRIANLQSGDKAQLRRAGFWPRETVNAVYIGHDGTLYDAHGYRCSRTGMERDIVRSVNEWLKAHREAA